MRALKRMLIRYKHSPRRKIYQKYIIALSIAIVIIAVSAISLLVYPTITGMHSAPINPETLEKETHNQTTQFRTDNSTITGMHSAPINPETLEKELYNQVSQFRTDNQLPIIENSTKLEAIARKHSEDLAYNNEPVDYSEALEQNKLYCNFHAENILKTTNTDILQELLANETLKAPLLDPKLERMGIGIAINKSIYVTQDFCG